MKKATIQIQGKQVTVSEGDTILVNRFVGSKAEIKAKRGVGYELRDGHV